MQNTQELKNLIKTQNLLFSKTGCHFCHASHVLLDKIIELGIIKDYKTLLVEIDFGNTTLTKIVSENGWKSDFNQEYCTKPQIFIDGIWIGDNFALYNSKYNLGDDFGMINGVKAPKLANPMPF